MRVIDKLAEIKPGTLIVVVTILYAVIIFLVNDRQTHAQISYDKFVENQNALNDNMESRMEHMEWYRDQGVDFSAARKLDIKPRTKAEEKANK